VTTLDTVTAGSARFVLRRATIADVAPIVALLAADHLGATRESTDAADLAQYQRTFAAIDADPAHLLVVVTAKDGTIAGTMQLSFLPGLSRRGAFRAQIEGVRIHRDQRGSGLGAAMMHWAMAEARRRGCTLLQLTTDKSRADAHRFYERLGFVASHEGMKLAL
jgi:GNAT superfamily N-acetyltransferase